MEYRYEVEGRKQEARQIRGEASYLPGYLQV